MARQDITAALSIPAARLRPFLVLAGWALGCVAGLMRVVARHCFGNLPALGNARRRDVTRGNGAA
jgi:hypothetical protein